MAAITTRVTSGTGATVKGSPLTNAEVDNNFINLNTEIVSTKAEVTPSRPTVRPSLLLDFAQTKQLDPRITFSRASTATYYDGKSVVKAEENLVKASGTFTTDWTTANCTLTQSATTAPDGTTTGVKLSEDSSSNAHILYTGLNGSDIAYSVSIYAKAAERQFIGIQVEGWLGQSRGAAVFDLGNGTVSTKSGTSYSFSIVYVGNGWYRLKCENFVSGGTGFNIIFYPSYSATPSFDSFARVQYAGTTGSGVYVWGAQVEARSYCTAYTPTTSSLITNYIPALQTAASGTARFDHDPVTGESKGLLIEEQRTNILPYSNDFVAATVGVSQASALVYSSTCIAPDGTLTAAKLVENSDNAPHRIYRTFATGLTVGAGSKYTFSVYLKAAERSRVRIWDNNQNTSGVTEFNLANGTIASGVGSIVSAGNGWYRCIITPTVDYGANAVLFIQILDSNGTQSYAGTSGFGVYLWGMQAEVGAFATSYIPTPLTYTGRASTATYKAADGLIRIAGNDVARYEPNAAGGSNLLLEGAASNVFGYSDSIYGELVPFGASLYARNAEYAPDGSRNAIVIYPNSTYMRRNVSLTTGTTYTISIYAKSVIGSASSMNFGTLWPGDGAGQISSVSVDSTWTRYTKTFTAVANDGAVYFQITSGSGLALWGAQLEVGSVATSYIPSTETHTGRSSTATYYDSTGTIRTAASGQPRYTYNPSLLTAPPKLLLEAQATNLYPYNFTGWSTWTSGGTLTATPNYATAPDGTTTATRLVLTGGGQSQYYYAVGGSAVSGAVYTMSFYSTSASPSLIVQTGADQTTNIGNEQVVYVGNGWYRHYQVFSTNVSNANIYRAVMNSAAYGTADITIWGAQLETGYAPTSYIPTSGSTVTRAADTSTSVAGSRAADVYSSSQVTRSVDSASMTGTNFSSWYRADEGTLYSEQYYANASGSDGYTVAMNDGTSSNYIALWKWGSDGKQYATAQMGGSLAAQGYSSSSLTPYTYAKGALGYKSNDFASMFNGASLITDTTNTYNVLNQMSIGSRNGNGVMTGAIKRIAYYPKRLSNSELQGLTS